jgi:5-methyltetrahydropteroyltriglutamate--homocysteine methyltransferase
VDCFAAMKIKQLVLEYATPRAGDLGVVGRVLCDREIGLGVTNPRTDEAEAVDLIAARIREALQYWPPERIFLNPDCGFGCFANRCVNEEQVAFEKLRAMVAAAKQVRAELQA